ncbi:hypothetical protein MKZ38_004467 [Zalerion maritima]|uniref:Uncharacterized protein n=1 Tax=Zalerion maritima TaxID=339359 RepID=A0AAD5WWX8_9PEZI|nr:hypothetical protein MKZ38_004467 [Zalerion maritima]
MDNLYNYLFGEDRANVWSWSFDLFVMIMFLLFFGIGLWMNSSNETNTRTITTKTAYSGYEGVDASLDLEDPEQPCGQCDQYNEEMDAMNKHYLEAIRVLQQQHLEAINEKHSKLKICAKDRDDRTAERDAARNEAWSFEREAEINWTLWKTASKSEAVAQIRLGAVQKELEKLKSSAFVPVSSPFALGEATKSALEAQLLEKDSANAQLQEQLTNQDDTMTQLREQLAIQATTITDLETSASQPAAAASTNIAAESASNALVLKDRVIKEHENTIQMKGNTIQHLQATLQSCQQAFYAAQYQVRQVQEQDQKAQEKAEALMKTEQGLRQRERAMDDKSKELHDFVAQQGEKIESLEATVAQLQSTDWRHQYVEVVARERQQVVDAAKEEIGQRDQKIEALQAELNQERQNHEETVFEYEMKTGELAGEIEKEKRQSEKNMALEAEKNKARVHGPKENVRHDLQHEVIIRDKEIEELRKQATELTDRAEGAELELALNKEADKVLRERVGIPVGDQSQGMEDEGEPNPNFAAGYLQAIEQAKAEAERTRAQVEGAKKGNKDGDSKDRKITKLRVRIAEVEKERDGAIKKNVPLLNDKRCLEKELQSAREKLQSINEGYGINI